MRTRRLSPFQGVGLVVMLAALVGLAVLVGCGGDGTQTSATTATTTVTTTTTTTTTTTPAPPTPAAPSTADVVVYFMRGEKLAPVHRTVDRTSIATNTVRALLSGPTSAETKSGLSSAIPSGTDLLGLSIARRVATADLSGRYDDGGGTLSMSARLAQVTYTLAQFATVDGVRFRLDGQPVRVFSGEGLVLDGPQTLQSFDELAPPILVEHPAPNQSVNRSLRIAGNANVFEATVNYEVRNSAGRVVRAGFMMATCGTGCRGTFDVTLRFGQPSPGSGEVDVFAFSPKDGSRLGLVTIPVRFM